MALNVSPLTDVKICRDPNDDMFLSLAIAAGADCLITRDEDLLVLHPFKNMPVLNTSDFMRRFFPN
jgi:uncharacterized protein